MGAALAALLGAAPAWSQSAGATPGGDAIAAVVGDQVITESELALRMEAARQQFAQRGLTSPPATQLRAELLDEFINQVALAEYAEDTGIHVTPDTIERAMGDIAASYKLTPAQFRSQISGEGLGWDEYATQVKREILISRLRQRDVASRVKVSDREIDEFLAKQSHKDGGAETQVDLAQIVVPLPSQPTAQQVDAARARIDAARAQLKQGRDFAAVAASVDAGAAKSGGDLGMRPLSGWPSLFVDAVRNLRPGEVSDVVRSPAGFHILKLVAVRDASALPRTAMQAHVREIVLAADGDAARDAAIKELTGVRDAVEQNKVDFAAKARELSQDMAGAKQGGDMGWVLPGELPAALDAALNRMNPGQVSDPLVVGDKVVLMQLIDRREQPLAKDQERAVARTMLLREHEQRDFQDLIKDVRARTYVRIPDGDS